MKSAETATTKGSNRRMDLGEGREEESGFGLVVQGWQKENQWMVQATFSLSVRLSLSPLVLSATGDFVLNYSCITLKTLSPSTIPSPTASGATVEQKLSLNEAFRLVAPVTGGF